MGFQPVSPCLIASNSSMCGVRASDSGIEIKPRRLFLALTAPTFGGVPDHMLLTILVGFFLIRIGKSSDCIEMLDMLDRCLITVMDPTAPTRLIHVLGLLFTRCHIARSRCPCKT